MTAATLTSEIETLPNGAASRAVCLHCGDPCAPGGGDFCCAGCEAVYSLLASHGLTAFYACDVTAGRSQRDAGRRDPDRFAVLDDRAIAARFIAPVGADLSRATFALPAMHCASCIWLLERLWRFDPGIGRSEADVLARTVRVDFDPRRTSLRAIAERLAALGYEPLLDGERDASAIPAVRRSLYLKLGVAGFAFGNVMLFSIPRYAQGAPLEPAFQRLFDALNLAFTLPVLVYSASDYLLGAWRALRARHVTIDVPVALGLLVLFGRSAADVVQSRGPGFFDSFAGLVFFLLIGRLFQQKTFERIAFDRSSRSFLPLAVYVERGPRTERTPIDRLEPGDVLRLRPHEVVPADAIVVGDEARVDNAFVTGEQTPVVLSPGDRLSAGSRIVGRAARVRVERPVSHTRLAELWANPVFSRPKSRYMDDLSSRFGLWFTVTAIALAAAGAICWWPDVRMSAEVATAVLIIACPCALTLAAPIATGTAMTVLGRAGLYLKHASVVMDLARTDTIVFDKTGTLTTTGGADAGAEPPPLDPASWRLVQALASHSIHPISRALAGPTVAGMPVENVREEPGLGVSGLVNGHRVAIGSAAFVAAEMGHAIDNAAGATWAAVDGARPQPLRVGADLRPGAEAAVASLARDLEAWLLSGDRVPDASSLWPSLFGDRVWFRQSPEDKLAVVTSLRDAGRRVLMVGDGLNDAGALAAAHAGIAVSDDTACLVPACDAVLQGARVADMPALLRYARRTPAVIAFCFAVSVIYNVVGVGLALAGALTPLAAAILMPVSSMTIVGLATGLMRVHAPAVSS